MPWPAGSATLLLSAYAHYAVPARFVKRGWLLAIPLSITTTTIKAWVTTAEKRGEATGVVGAAVAAGASAGLAAAAMLCWHKVIGLVVFPGQVCARVGRVDKAGAMWDAMPQAMRQLAYASPDNLRPYARKRREQFESALGVRSREVRIPVPGTDAWLHGVVLVPPGGLDDTRGPAPVAVVLQGNSGCWEHDLAFNANTLVPFLRCGCAVLLYNPQALGSCDPEDAAGMPTFRPLATRDGLVGDCLAAVAAATRLPSSLTSGSTEKPAWLGTDDVGAPPPDPRNVLICGHSLGGAVACAAAAACAHGGDSAAPWLDKATAPHVTAVCASRSFDALTCVAGMWLEVMTGLPESAAYLLSVALVGALGGWDLCPRRDLARAAPHLAHAWVEYHPRDRICVPPCQLDTAPRPFAGNVVVLDEQVKGDAHNRELTEKELEQRLAHVVQWRQRSLACNPSS